MVPNPTVVTAFYLSSCSAGCPAAYYYIVIVFVFKFYILFLEIFSNIRYKNSVFFYNNALNGLVKKHNKMFRDYELPHITPHVLRHTFCTNMANARMTPNNLQYIMGHKNITMTLGYYTHASCESAMTEMLSIVA